MERLAEGWGRRNGFGVKCLRMNSIAERRGWMGNGGMDRSSVLRNGECPVCPRIIPRNGECPVCPRIIPRALILRLRFQQFFDSFPEGVAYPCDENQCDPDRFVYVHETVI